MSSELRASLRCEIDAWELHDIASPLMGFGRARKEGSIEREKGETKMGLDTKWTSS